MTEGNKMTIPVAILVAGILIAGALYFVNRDSTPQPAAQQNQEQQAEDSPENNVKPVSANDHILGSPDADLIIIEYSDLECPFCKTYHATMHQIIDEYGKDGRVAWVYRHFPLTQLHSKAAKEAEAAECAADLGGNQTFWSYIDRIYDVTPSGNGLDLGLLPKIAVELGLDEAAFEECLSSGKFEDAVKKSFDEAVAAGGRGTPHNLIIAGGEVIPVEGAQPYQSLKSIIESILTDQSGLLPEGHQAVPAI